MRSLFEPPLRRSLVMDRGIGALLTYLCGTLDDEGTYRV